MDVTVILAEDHAFTLLGVQQAMTAHGLTVLATTQSGIGAIALARLHQPDVAVLDFAMPDADGLSVHTEIRRWSPRTRTAIVTATATPGTLAAIAAAGVAGLFSKASAVEFVCDGIRRVARGEIVRSPDIAAILAAADNPAARQVTGRELEVLKGIAAGLTNGGIAVALSISPKTVESHRASLMRKLAVNSTAALLVRAVREGLIEI